jgi:glycosyltransferase involved in cell wall biosynthesis
MARICIVTQEVNLGGGVLTKLLSFLKYAKLRHHVCDIYLPVSANIPAENVRILKEAGPVENIFQVPVYPRLPTFLNSWQFGRRCNLPNTYEAYHLIAGSLHQGLPLIKQDLPFTVWIAGSHVSEVKGLSRARLHHFLLYNPLTNFLSERQEMAVGEKARKVLVVSSYSAREIHLRLGVPSEKIQVIPVPVDTTQMVPGSSASHQSPPCSILSVARLDRRKDFPTLIKAFKMVADETTGIELRIVGDGKERRNLEALVKDLALDGRVFFLGHISQEDLKNEYQRAGLFALASRQEGLGIVFLEAMSFGLPIVATNSGGSADPIQHGVTGYLAPVGDWKSLGRHMLEILKNPFLLEKFSKAARQRAVEHYDFSRVNQLFDTVYAENFGIISPRADAEYADAG